jgi:hypothetical protein
MPPGQTRNRDPNHQRDEYGFLKGQQGLGTVFKKTEPDGDQHDQGKQGHDDPEDPKYCKERPVTLNATFF